jgi:uncharacterized protein
MPQNLISPATEPSMATAMTPVRPKGRIEVIDVLRGFSVLGILLVNMMGFSGYPDTPIDQLEPVHRATTLLIRFVAQAKFYTLFSFLFGWGMAVQMERAAARGARFAPLYVRRLLILLLIGLVHAILIWDGDILVTYAVLGLPLLLFRKHSNRTLLVAVVICLLIPVLISTPGPAESFREAYAKATDGLRQEAMAGFRANVYADGTYREVAAHRWKNSLFGYTQFIYWSTHVFGMFLLGLYVGRRRILHDVQAHLPLFRRVMWWGLVVGVVLNLVFVAVADLPSRVPDEYYQLATRSARTIGGSALCLFYISAIVLLSQKQKWRRRLSPLAPVGRMALSNYLFHSIVCTLIFNGYGLGLYGRFGPAITLILTFVIYRVQVSLSGWWLDRFHFGPMEWLWRSLTYGKVQSLAPGREEERERATRFQSVFARPAQPGETQASAPPESGDVDVTAEPGRESTVLSDWFLFVLRRLAFIAAVGFAIVYFCILGLSLTSNSTAAMGRTRSVLDQAGPALNETFQFFGRTLHGDLGYVIEGVTEQMRVPVAQILGDTFVRSGSLLVVSIGVAALLGIAAGGLAALRRFSALSLSTLTLTVIGVSIPSFFLALLIQIADIRFYQRTGIGLFPVYGISSHRTASLLPQVVAPALVLAARPLAHVTRVTFVSISEILNRDYIRTAHAKGLGPSVVFWRHTLRNAGVSIFTAMIVSLRFALGSLPVVEVFFDWPGLGVTMLNAIYERRSEVVAALALSLGVAFLLVNLLVDLLYRYIDPRLRTGANGGES